MTPVLLALSLAAQAQVNPSYDLPKGLERVSLASVEGDVTVRVDPAADHVVLQAIDRRPGKKCRLAMDRDRARNRLALEFGPKDLEDPKACRVDFAVTLPPDVAFSLDLRLGDVDVAGVATELALSVAEGDVTLADQTGAALVRVADGDIEVARVSGALRVDLAKGRLHGTPEGPVDARVGEGRIQLEGLLDRITADTAVGDILLAYAASPMGPVQLNAGNGHVVVDLPDGVPVQPRMSSMTGTTTCELPTGDGVEVIAVAGLGSVRLH